MDSKRVGNEKEKSRKRKKYYYRSLVFGCISSSISQSNIKSPILRFTEQYFVNPLVTYTTTQISYE